MENNTTNTKGIKGQTITFYSYKGGVGRSMALVNIACLAAKENKKILLIDCDLEAPGLHQFFKTREETPGFVDLIWDINEWILKEENNDEKGYERFMTAFLKNYVEERVNPIAPVSVSLNMSSPEQLPNNNPVFDTTLSVDLIKAGRFNNEYSKKLSNISWVDIYKKAPAFFRSFACYLEKHYDYIFVDARTGLADTSGICTMLMPQKLVLVFALNNQNINGVVDVARQAIDYRFASNDHRPLHVYPLPSRIENSANPHLQQWINNYKEKFVKLFTEKYMLDECRLSPYFDRSFIQYYAIHAYGENLPVLYESVSSSNFITYNYNSFLTVLKKNIPAWEVISIEEEQEKEKLAAEYFRKALDLYYKNEFEKAIEELTKAIGLKKNYPDGYIERGNSKHMIKQYEAAIEDYSLAIELEPNYGLAYGNRGLSKSLLEKYEEAIADYDKGIELDKDFSDAYCNRGYAKTQLKKYSEAIEDFNMAIKLAPNDPDPYQGRAVVQYVLKQYDQAIKDSEAGSEISIRLNKEDKMGYNIRACIYREIKNYELARYNNEKSLLIDNKNPINWATKAEILSDMGDEDGFFEHLEKAITLGLNLKSQVEEESEIMNKYLSRPRFLELLKKYNIELAAEALPAQ